MPDLFNTDVSHFGNVLFQVGYILFLREFTAVTFDLLLNDSPQKHQHMKKLLTIIIIVAAFTSCKKDNAANNSSSTTEDRIATPPPVVSNAFKANFGSVSVSEWKLRNDNTWRAHFTNNGKAWEATFDSTGNLLKSEAA